MELKGINTLGVVNTEKGSEIELLDNDEGTGTTISEMQLGGNM